MNDELQKQLAQMLASLQGTAQTAASWTAAQIPPLVHEKIVFGRWDETLQLSLALIAAVGCAWIVWFMFSHIEDSNDELGWVFGMIAGAIGFVLSAVGVSAQLHNVLLVWFAPRLYVVEWLKTLVTK